VLLAPSWSRSRGYTARLAPVASHPSPLLLSMSRPSSSCGSGGAAQGRAEKAPGIALKASALGAFALGIIEGSCTSLRRSRGKPVTCCQGLSAFRDSLSSRRPWRFLWGSRRSAATARAALAALEADVEVLRQEMPPNLLAISSVAPAPLVVDSRGEMQTPTAEMGPWDVHVTFRGREDDTVHQDPFNVRLRFTSSWPAEPPQVRIGGLFKLTVLNSERGPPTEFYNQLQRGADDSLILADVLEKARLLVLEPVRALGLEQYIGSDAKSATGSDDKAVLARRVQSWTKYSREANEKRMDVIQKYRKLVKHPQLFDPRAPLDFAWLAPELVTVVENPSPAAWRRLVKEEVPGQVFSFPLFTDDFCDTFLEEVFNFYDSGLPASRPNSMNNYGIIISDIGLEPFVDKLQQLLQPLGRALFSGAGSSWDGHHCFIVRYRQGEDLGLDMHTDDSDVTFNICLGLEFSGAGLQFCGQMGAANHRQHNYTYFHKKGQCVVHLGRKRHGADDIQSGERLNLILWNHGSAYRRSNEYRRPEYAKERSPPDPLCVSYTHDRDFGMFREYPAGKEEFRFRGWCPPPEAEYDGFKPDREAVPFT